MSVDAPQPTVAVHRRRLRQVATPGWRRWVWQTVIVCALVYGSWRIYWALGAGPSFPPVGTDLVVFTGWWSVVLCGAAAVVVVALRRAAWRRPLALAAWGVSVALVAASALLLSRVGIGSRAALASSLVGVAAGRQDNPPRSRRWPSTTRRPVSRSWRSSSSRCASSSTSC